MTKALMCFRVAIVVFTVGVIIQLSDAGETSWAVVDHETERQTVPTRTATPAPETPTVPTPTYTHTPEPPPASETPAPQTDETNTPVPVTPSITPTTTTTAEATGSAPTQLPRAGSAGWVLRAGAFLLANGFLLLLTGVNVYRRRRG